MIVSSNGIVLSMLRYSDSSVIAKVYTEEHGLRSFMVRTGKGKGALGKLGLLQPLSLVELAYSVDDRKNLHTVRSLERENALKTIPFDPVKTCIALFVAELIVRAIGEEEKNEQLFRFLHNSILLLDDETGTSANFHLKFMIEFTRFLGFYPTSTFQPGHYFDLSEGEFSKAEPMHPYKLNQGGSEKLSQLIQVGMSTCGSLKMTNTDRKELLSKLIDYYRLHLDGMKELKSHKVLQEVLS